MGWGGTCLRGQEEGSGGEPVDGLGQRFILFSLNSAAPSIRPGALSGGGSMGPSVWPGGIFELLMPQRGSGATEQRGDTKRESWRAETKLIYNREREETGRR